MADIDPTLTCTNCEHLASSHADTDTGENQGACAMDECTCSGMVTGDGAPVGEASLTPIITLADTVSGGSATAPSGVDPSTIATTLDTALDSASASIAALDPSTFSTDETTFVGLVNAAGAAVDMLLDALGAPDDDSGYAAETDAPTGDVRALAGAVVAAVTAASALAPDVKLDGLVPVAAAIKALMSDLPKLTDSVAKPEPDEAEPAPAKDPTDPVPGMAAEGEQFAPGPPAAPAAPAPAEDADPELPDDPSLDFEMPIMVLEGVDTGDGRFITPQALTWREPPLSVMAMTETSEWGHEGAFLVGRIDVIERIDASALTNAKTGEPYGEGVQALKATGTFASLDVAAQVAELVRGGFLRGVSVDVGDVVSELEVINDAGEAVEIDDGDLMDIMFMDGNMRENVTAGRVMGVTICPFPAFEGAYIVMAGGVATNDEAIPAVKASAEFEADPAFVNPPGFNVLDQFGARRCVPCEEGMPLLASAGPMEPPRSWFEDPQLQGPTPLTVTEDGRVYGHLAAWQTCHTGISGRCTTAPHSKSDYAHFHVGALKVADGDVISVGHITMGTGHAGLELGAGPAAAHYDHTGSVAADICVGEDKFGIWVAGATRPDLTELQLRQLRSSALSGDWRSIGRGLELTAALAVNVPGFPLPRARVASGAPESLVAAGGRELLHRALGTANTELAALRAWQQSVQPVIDKMLSDRADAIRTHVLDTRAAQLRAKVHSTV